MRILMIGLAATTLVACESTMEPMGRSDRDQAIYDRELAGKVAGKVEKCLPLHRTRDMEVIDDHTILFRDGHTVYVNTTLGDCNNMSDDSYALVTRNVGPQLCRGDLATVTDASSGMTVGSCSLGDFVPYRPAS